MHLNAHAFQPLVHVFEKRSNSMAAHLKSEYDGIRPERRSLTEARTSVLKQATIVSRSKRANKAGIDCA
jgi:hypothetical protein